MLPKGSIEATHIWKRFRAERRRGRIRPELLTLISRMRGKQVPWNWALRDVDLVAQPGESIALMGPNGSGKSTLLKILTRVMYPYAGSVKLSGRVGALIEVSAGIHPELSGRENVLVYGSLLGLRRRQVTERFDDIVSFAEIESAIDRQVKFYSSGMKMRLGFAIAAFLEPAILLVDEVLAVGDSSFQQKCLDRMREVLNQGTTLVFVSHDLAAMEATCSRGIWLNNGAVEADGPIEEVIGGYRRSIEEAAEGMSRLHGVVNLTKAEISGANGLVQTQEPVNVRLALESGEARTGALYLGVSQGPATPIFCVRRDLQLEQGQNVVECKIERLPLPKGRFYLWAGIFQGGGLKKWTHALTLLAWQPVGRFDVDGPTLDPVPQAVVRLAPVHVEATWEQS